MSSLLPLQGPCMEDHTQGSADSCLPYCALLALLPGQIEGVSHPWSAQDAQCPVLSSVPHERTEESYHKDI